MAKGGRPDKENMITGMFAKIARAADKEKQKAIREAKKRGEFYIIDNPELLSIPEQEKYYLAKRAFESGGNQYEIKYDKKDNTFPWPHHFMKDSDK